MDTAMDISEELSFVSVMCIVVAGMNIIWGMFLMPWGIFGYVSSAVDIFLFFEVLRIKNYYLARNYEIARNHTYYFTILAFIFGLIIIGIIAYRIFREMDNIILRRHLVRGKPHPLYGSPRIPR